MYKLEKLTYKISDLEPYIDVHTMALHYYKHAKGYEERLNKLLKINEYDYKYRLTELLYHLNEFKLENRENILYNLGGMLNHELFFRSINPRPKKIPNRLLLTKIEERYESLKRFFKEFKKSALKLKGSGYTFLVLDKNKNLDIINLPNQLLPISFNLLPLLCIDMWEHAYYLNYENEKNNYIDAFIEIADFSYADLIYERVLIETKN